MIKRVGGPLVMFTSSKETCPLFAVIVESQLQQDTSRVLEIKRCFYFSTLLILVSYRMLVTWGVFSSSTSSGPNAYTTPPSIYHFLNAVCGSACPKGALIDIQCI